ncbi:MAG: dTMP kinase [Burkholderiales bacterium PBB4]|nr:MAG: dTMP kinase [Burkholderiales bacterium PBB4]
MRGIFISFEGIDGAGKSTHIDGLAQAFRGEGREVTLTREPGGTRLAEQLRNMVLNEAMDPMTEALLVFAARRDHVLQVIRPALSQGHVVLCDRFSDASFAYQGAGREFDWSVLVQLEQWVQKLQPDSQDAIAAASQATLLKPDLTLWFDLPAEVAAQRLSSARVADRFEAQPQKFFEKVAGGYARRLAEDPSRFARIHADQKPEAVWTEVLSVLKERSFLQ